MMTVPLHPNLVCASEVVSVMGHQMVLNDSRRDSVITPSLLNLGCFEPFQTELVVNEVRPGDTVLDLGAHVGYYTLLLARQVGPRGKVLAFEPDPDNFARLKQNVELNHYTNVELFNCAVSDRAGQARLFRSAWNAGDHRLHPAPEDRPAIEVEVVTLDTVLRDRGAVDFIKMDVQGCEGAALEGMVGVLSRCRRVKIIAEFWPHGLKRSGYGATRLLERLSSLGFRLYEVDEAERSVRHADPRQLVTLYPASSEERFTNLLCVKAPLVPGERKE